MLSPNNPIGIDPGQFLDEPIYSEINGLAWQHLSAADYPVQFGTAWNALGYRARSAETHASAFASLFTAEPAASVDDRLGQERELFGFIMNAAALADVLAFASYLIALAARGLPLDDAALKKLIGQTWNDTRAHAPALADHLELDRKSPVGQALFDDRNTLVHRGCFRRSHSLMLGSGGTSRTTIPSNPKASPSLQISDRELGPGMLHSSIDWLKAHVKTALPLLRAALCAIPPHSSP